MNCGLPHRTQSIKLQPKFVEAANQIAQLVFKSGVNKYVASEVTAADAIEMLIDQSAGALGIDIEAILPAVVEDPVAEKPAKKAKKAAKTAAKKEKEVDESHLYAAKDVALIDIEEAITGDIDLGKVK